jgi:hypothetical protein
VFTRALNIFNQSIMAPLSNQQKLGICLTALSLTLTEEKKKVGKKMVD